MENIKDLTPAQMMELVETWCSEQDNRHFIGSIGISNDEGIDASSAVIGKGEELSIMLENLLDTEKDLAIAAMERILIKRRIEPDIEESKLKNLNTIVNEKGSSNLNSSNPVCDGRVLFYPETSGSSFAN